MGRINEGSSIDGDYAIAQPHLRDARRKPVKANSQRPSCCTRAVMLELASHA